MPLIVATFQPNLVTIWAQTGAVNIYAGLNREFTTDSDSVAFNDSLTGVYSWDFHLEAADASVLSPSLSILSPYVLNDHHQNASRFLKGSLYEYNWTFPNIAPGSQTNTFKLSSAVAVIFNPGYMSARVIAPWKITSPTSSQTIVVFVEPHRAFSGFWVDIAYWDSTKTDASFLSASPMQGFSKEAPNEITWDVYPAEQKLYKFTAVFAIRTKSFPDIVFHKPVIEIGATINLENNQLSPGGSRRSVRIVNANGLGNVTYSATGSYTWSYLPRVRNRVIYRESVVSAYLREVPFNNISETTTSTNGSLNIGRNTEGNWLVLINDPLSSLLLGVVVVIMAVTVAVFSRRRRPPEDKTKVY